MNSLWRAAQPATWALRAYAWPAVWLTLAGMLALAIGLPVMAGTPGLELAPVRASDFGIEWTTLAVPPTAIQQHALRALSAELMNLAIVVLLVAAVTIAALSLVRASARRTELGVRRAVGASQRDIRFAALIEGGVLAGIAVVLGTSAGVVGVHLALANWPGSASVGPLGPILVTIAGLGGVIVAGALLPVVTTRARRVSTIPATPPHGLVVPALQLGISLAVLVAAAQLGRSADAVVSAARTGAGDGSLFTVAAPGPRPVDRATQYATLLRELRSAKQLDIVSLSSVGALAGLGTEDLVLTDCGRCFQGGLPMPTHPVPAILHAVSPDTFRALGAPLVAGRGFASSDGWRESGHVAVVNEALAARHFEDGHAVGRRVFLGRNGWYTVIGVVRDKTGVGFAAGTASPYAVYVSALEQPPDRAELLLRGRGAAAARIVRRAVGVAFGGQGDVLYADQERRVLAAQAAPLRWFGRLFGLEGGGALLIAVIGTFAMMRMWVQGALPELATRRAAGATKRDVLRFVLVKAAIVGVGGVVVGLWLGIIVSGLLASVVGALPVRSPDLVIPPAAALVAAALLGALMPAWTAVRATPAALFGSNAA
jgi:putative ABC transport system permease protein